MKIEGLGPLFQPDTKEKKPEKTQKPHNEVPDKVEINAQGEKIAKPGYSRDVKNAKLSHIEQAKDYRQIKQRSTEGYYDKPEIKESTSEKLIESKELKDVIGDYHRSHQVKNSGLKKAEIRHEKVAEAKKKIDSGFYSNPENYQSFAQKIIDHFGL